MKKIWAIVITALIIVGLCAGYVFAWDDPDPPKTIIPISWDDPDPPPKAPTI